MAYCHEYRYEITTGTSKALGTRALVVNSKLDV
jgi:hypothetical protein